MAAEQVAEGFMCWYDFPAPFISISLWRAWICLKLSMAPHCWGATQGDLFIWLLPSKLARPLDRWRLCPSSRWAVSLSGTKQLEGQLCGDSSYSLSLFLLAFTLSLLLHPPYHHPSISPIALLPNTQISHALSIFPIFPLLLICWCKFG